MKNRWLFSQKAIDEQGKIRYNDEWKKFKNPSGKIKEKRLFFMKYFGTDGIRGEANVELTFELAYKTGLGLATILDFAKK